MDIRKVAVWGPLTNFTRNSSFVPLLAGKKDAPLHLFIINCQGSTLADAGVHWAVIAVKTEYYRVAYRLRHSQPAEYHKARKNMWYILDSAPGIFTNSFIRGIRGIMEKLTRTKGLEIRFLHRRNFRQKPNDCLPVTLDFIVQIASQGRSPEDVNQLHMLDVRRILRGAFITIISERDRKIAKRMLDTN